MRTAGRGWALRRGNSRARIVSRIGQRNSLACLPEFSGGKGVGSSGRRECLEAIGSSEIQAVNPGDVLESYLSLLGRKRIRTVIGSCPREMKNGRALGSRIVALG